MLPEKLRKQVKEAAERQFKGRKTFSRSEVIDIVEGIIEKAILDSIITNEVMAEQQGAIGINLHRIKKRQAIATTQFDVDCLM